MSAPSEAEIRRGIALNVIDLEICAGLGLNNEDAISAFLADRHHFGIALSDWFDPVAYIKVYTDVASGTLHPALHYIRHGYDERRSAFPVMSSALAQITADRRRVWIESHDLSLTGAPIALGHLLEGWPELAKNAYLGAPASGPLKARFQDMNAHVVLHGQSARRACSRNDARVLARSCAEILRDSGCRSVIANSFMSWPMVIAARDTGIPFHWIIHEPYPDEMQQTVEPELMDDILSFAQDARTLIFVSQDSAQKWGFDEDNNCHVIEKALPNKVQPPRQSGRVAAHCGDDDVLILSVGSISPRKGQLDLIEALDHLASDPISQKLVVVLVGFNESDYAKSVRKGLQGLRERGMRLFMLRESRSDEERRTVEHLFAAADIFVMTSRAESLPLTTVEALAAGCPVVSSDAPGIGDLIVDGETGLLYQAGDYYQLANCLLRLASDPSLRQSMRRTISHNMTDLAYKKMIDSFQSAFIELW